MEVKKTAKGKGSVPPLNSRVPVDKGNGAFYCTCCPTKYKTQPQNFYRSFSPLYAHNGGYLPICKECCNTLYRHYWRVLGSAKEAVRRMCMKLDVYWDEVAFDSLDEGIDPADAFARYMGGMSYSSRKNKTYDTTLDRAVASTAETVAVEVGQQDRLDWGMAWEDEEIRYLKGQYSRWEQEYSIESRAQEILVRDMCIMELQRDKAMRANDVANYSKLSDLFQRTMDRAELSPSKLKEQRTSRTKPLGVILKEMEDTKPIPEPAPEFRDVDGIIRFFRVYCIGHLCHMLGIKHRYAQLYEDEMNKYRVSADEKDADDVYERLMDEGFPKAPPDLSVLTEESKE